MNQISNLNATLIKEAQYNASLQPSSKTINFTITNCSVNAFVQQIIFNLAGSQTNFAQGLSLSLNDRGNSYAGLINGFYPETFTTVSTSPVIYPLNQSTPNMITQNGNIIVVDVLQSTQDSEGLGNIYVQVNNSNGFNVNFTMSVVYRPEITYNSDFNTRNQIGSDRPFRVLSQLGLSAYNAPGSVMADQTATVFKCGAPRNNVDILTNGFIVNSSNPYFYFGTPYPTKRWFLGFSSDNTPNIGIVTFSYFSGSQFVGFSNTQVAIGANGPGTYKFANDGVIIFTPPTNWAPLQMSNDPLTVYNNTIIGLGTLASNNLVNNPNMFWVQCQVGFNGLGTLIISSLTPLIDPALPLTTRRRLL
jgi:hypothetical protein